MRQYLPSKKFVIIILSALTLIGGFFYLSGKLKRNAQGALVIKNDWSWQEEKPLDLTLQSLVEKDTDQDGIPDWEESLWGLDPNNKQTHTGISDKDWVKERRNLLQGLYKNTDQNKGPNETEKFAREFFTTIAALKESGTYNKQKIGQISTILGQKITDVDLGEPFSLSDLKSTTDFSSTGNINYYNKMQDLFLTYSDSGLGTEIEIIAGSVPNSENMSSSLKKISEAYQKFALGAKEIIVPKDLTSHHLKIIISAFNTGIAVNNLAFMAEDPVLGLLGLSQYQKYNGDFVSAAEDLRLYLENSDII